MKQTLIAAAIFLGVASLSQAGPFTNGSFESPSGFGAVFLANGDTSVTGWTHGGNAFGEFHTPGEPWGISAGDGTRYIGWGANGATNGTLFQTFDTVVDTTYTIDYLLTTQQLTGTLPIQSNLVEALDGTTVLNFVTNSFNQPAGVWNAGATLSFVAASNSTTLRFTDTTPAGNSGPINWGLDAVTVSGLEGPVIPEPSTYTLFGLGFLVLAVGRRKWSAT